MMPRRSRSRAAWVLLATLIAASPPLFAQAVANRLSDWLLEQPSSPDAYPLGLSWRVPEEIVPQSAQLLELLRNLSGTDREISADPQAMARLRNWLRTLPVTGRVSVPIADARWLQANPARDPILQSGHTVTMPRRPKSITVITAQGDLCPVTHVPGREAQAYLEACAPGSVRQTDVAWVAQPDGRVQRHGVAAWNSEVQDEPAPGAWLWGPPRNSGWNEEVSYRLISFLATQGPAPDPVDRPVERTVALPPATRSRDAEITANNWGGVGLIQTPTARMAKAGNFSFLFSRTFPYSQANTFAQPFDWLETGCRGSAKR